MLNVKELVGFQTCYSSSDSVDFTRINLARNLSLQRQHGCLEEWLNELLINFPKIFSQHVECSGSIVSIGNRCELSLSQWLDIQVMMRVLCPWKKGPFLFFGTLINSEWRSDLKWSRIEKECGSLKDQIVADIGCNNGYFMFRMSAHQPKLVIGFEPVLKYYYTFLLFQKFSNLSSLLFEPFGVEFINSYNNFFDKIFCLGILYHHRSPVDILRDIFFALKRKGEVFIDCQGVDSSDNICLFPEKKYAGARGVWFLPSKAVLLVWLRRVGFIDIKCFYAEPLSFYEQRSTCWASICSLESFIDKKDTSRTVEGYPAPWRYYVKAKKP